jgi:hypothetical protein
VPCIIGRSTKFAMTLIARRLELWATIIAGMRSSYGSTGMVANSRTTGFSQRISYLGQLDGPSSELLMAFRCSMMML